MVALALEAEYGDSWDTEAYVEDLLKLRVVPQMLPLDPCCMPIYNTKNQLVHDVRYWLDFSVVSFVFFSKFITLHIPLPYQA